MLTECEHGGVVGSQDGNQFRCTECDRSGPQLDLSDHEIREMAERNHTPSEVWTNGGQLYGVLCDQCGHEWPCPTRMALRAPSACEPAAPCSISGCYWHRIGDAGAPSATQDEPGKEGA